MGKDFIQVKPGQDKYGMPAVQAIVTSDEGITTLEFTTNEAKQFADILNEGVKQAIEGTS
jgi:hypothetical protein